MNGFPPTSQSVPINLGAFGVAASAALVVLFVLCWLVAALLPGIEVLHTVGSPYSPKLQSVPSER